MPASWIWNSARARLGSAMAVATASVAIQRMRVCCKNNPPVCVSQPHIAYAILNEARATDQLLWSLYKLENLQMGIFSEVRQKICQGPELSVLTSPADNQSFMRRPPRLRMQVSDGPFRKRWALFLFRSRSQREMAYSFFTIGHSTRTVSQFVDLLQASQIEFVVDVRHIPRSRTERFDRMITSVLARFRH